MSNSLKPNEMQTLMKDILIGLKTKLIQPILNDNNQLTKKVEDLREREHIQYQELKEKMLLLEQKIDQIPVHILESIRNAIEEAGEN